jgi:TatD DNase family protein
VLERAARVGLAAVIVTGSCLRSTQAAATLCRDNQIGRNGGSAPALFYTAGVHPHNAKNCDEATLGVLRSLLASDPRCVAVGECGMDFNRDFSPRDLQLRWFEAHVEVAIESKKPLFLHCRDAWGPFFEVLERRMQGAPLSGVLHCFTGGKDDLLRALGLGLFVGVTGWACDERPGRRGDELAALLPLIPLDRLLLETDAPYLTPRTIQ